MLSRGEYSRDSLPLCNPFVPNAMQARKKKQVWKTLRIKQRSPCIGHTPPATVRCRRNIFLYEMMQTCRQSIINAIISSPTRLLSVLLLFLEPYCTAASRACASRVKEVLERYALYPLRAFSRSRSSVSWLFDLPKGIGGAGLGGVGVKCKSSRVEDDGREASIKSSGMSRASGTADVFLTVSESNCPWTVVLEVATTVDDTST